MKKLIHLTYIIIYCLLPVSITAQVGIGTVSPQPSLLLDINGNNTRGALLPRFTIPNLFMPNPVNSPKTDLIAVNSYNQSVPAESTFDTRGLTYWDGNKWKMIQKADQLKITKNSSSGGQDMSGLVLHYVRDEAVQYGSGSPNTGVYVVLNKMPLTTDVNSTAAATNNPKFDETNGYVKFSNRNILQPFYYDQRGTPFRVVNNANPYDVYEITYIWEGTLTNAPSVTARIAYVNTALGPSNNWTILKETIAYPDANNGNKVSVKMTWKGVLRTVSEIGTGLFLPLNMYTYKHNQTYEELIVRRIGEAQ